MKRIVGRDSELAQLREISTALLEGEGRCLVIEGPPGIGKSLMLSVAVEQAVNSGITVAAGMATAIDRAAPLTTLLTSLRSCDPPILEELASIGGPDTNRFLLVDQLGAVIESYAREHPLLITIDDLQWADELTVLALRVLIPQLSGSPVSWIFAKRDLPVETPGQRLVLYLAEGSAGRMTLDSLSEDATAVFCRQFLGARPSDALLAMANRCGGNPFLLRQLLGSVRSDGGIRVDGSQAKLITDDVPDSFTRILDTRLGELSTDARRLVEVGAVLSRPFDIFEISRFLGMDSTEVVPLVAETERTDVLVAHGSELTFRHELIREAVYRRISAPVREILHRQSAEVLRTEGRSPAEIIDHLIRSGRGGTSQAVEIAFQTVDQIAMTAPGHAADILCQVLKLLDEDHTERPAIAVEAVRLLASVGRLRQARELGESMLRPGLPVTVEAAILLGLAEALKHAGQDLAVVDYTGRALEKAGLTTAKAAKLHAIRAHAMLNAGCIDDVEEIAGKGVLLSTEADAHGAHVFCLTALITVEQAKGNLAAALSQAHEAVRVADSHGGESVHWHPRLWLGQALMMVDRITEANSVLELACSETEQLGTAWAQPLYYYLQAELWMARGRLADAKAEAEAGLFRAEQMTAYALSVPLLSTLIKVAVREGDMQQAWRLLDDARKLVDDGIGSRMEDYPLAAAMAHDADGCPETAMAEVSVLYEAIPKRRLVLTQDPTVGPFLVRLALKRRDRAAAAKVVEALADLAQRNPEVRSLSGAAFHARGLFEADVDALRRAVEIFDSGLRGLAAAESCEDTAIAELDAGRPEAGRELLEEARRRYLDCGALLGAGRVADKLKFLGAPGRRTGRGAAPGTRSHGCPLTESELRVARLVAQGMTNREVGVALFLSRHTVDSHLRHAFTKLGINNRVSLSRWVMEYDALGSAQKAEARNG
nr:AAA family ATPase [Glycomyces sp. TRM65418]